MEIGNLFNIPTTSVTRRQQFGAEIASGKEAAPVTSNLGAFVTPQSLVTFPGATGVITALWAAIKAFNVVPASFNLLLGAAISIVVGSMVYLVSEVPTDRRSRLMAIGIAVINTVLLFNAARAVIGT